MYFLIHFLQFNCINWWWSGWQLLELQTLPDFKHFLTISISSNRRKKRNHLGRSEVYFSATVDLAKARRCFNKEPRYVLRRMVSKSVATGWKSVATVSKPVTAAWLSVLAWLANHRRTPTKRCSSPIEPHFLGARYFVFMGPTARGLQVLVCAPRW